MNVPFSGCEAFAKGFNRGQNPFDYDTQFDNWLQWDNEWITAKSCGIEEKDLVVK